MTLTVGVVACCGQKAGELCQAKDLYQSALFRKSRAYVEANCAPWVILSAKHGVLRPDDEIAPYDLRLSQLPLCERVAWAERCREQLRDMFPSTAVYLVLAGEEYRRVFEDRVGSVTRVYLSHEAPLEGLGIGKRLAWLTQQGRQERE